MSKWIMALAMLFAATASAQTIIIGGQVIAGGQLITGSNAGPVLVATGDARLVTEPTIPSVCQQFAATKWLQLTNTVNIDPYNIKPTDNSNGCTGGAGHGTLGCNGGWSYEPSSSSSSYIESETLDNTAFQAALTACQGVGAVEIVRGSGGQNAMVLKPLTGSGLTAKVIIDAGVYVLGSRNLSDYGGTNCGVTAASSSCKHMFTGSTAHVGFYGYGTFNGRGWDCYIGHCTAGSTQGFYEERAQAYYNKRGGAKDGSPACCYSAVGDYSYGSNFLKMTNADDFTLYQVTIKDPSQFFVEHQGGTGVTGWGIKMFAPFWIPNTDGWDPDSDTNTTLTRSFYSGGDNIAATKSKVSLLSNATISYSQGGAGVGWTTGVESTFNEQNILFDHLIARGNTANSLDEGIGIGGNTLYGGTTDQVTFRNVCMWNEDKLMRFYTNANGSSGTAGSPVFTNLLLENIASANTGSCTFQGDGAGVPIVAQIDNVTTSCVGVEQQGSRTTDQYSTIYLGPNQVSTSLTTRFVTDALHGVSTIGSGSGGTAYPCSTSMWQDLVGTLNLYTTANHNLQNYTGATPYTLQVVLQPTTAVNSQEAKAPTASVQFKDNGTTIGTVALGGDGSFAEFTVSSASSGTHVYTAFYPGDANYSSYTFGSVTVTIP